MSTFNFFKLYAKFLQQLVIKRLLRIC